MKEKEDWLFRVANFGNDRYYDDLDEMLEGLRSNYRGHSVAVQVRTPQFGMVRAFFVDVSKDGHLLESYGDFPNKRLDVGRIRSATMTGHSAAEKIDSDTVCRADAR